MQISQVAGIESIHYMTKFTVLKFMFFIFLFIPNFNMINVPDWKPTTYIHVLKLMYKHI